MSSVIRKLGGAGACRRLVVACLLMAPASALAQDHPAPVVELSGGWVGFADDGVVSETMVGGAGRWYVHPRVGIGPEVVYIHGDNHSHAVVTGNLTWDLAPDAGPASGGVTPFLVVGGGMFQTRQTFGEDTVTSREGAFTGGGGLRVHVTDRISVGVDARVGWELHVRVGGFVGLRLGP